MRTIERIRIEAKKPANLTNGELTLLWITIWVVMILAIIATYT